MYEGALINIYKYIIGMKGVQKTEPGFQRHTVTGPEAMCTN